MGGGVKGILAMTPLSLCSLIVNRPALEFFVIMSLLIQNTGEQLGTKSVSDSMYLYPVKMQIPLEEADRCALINIMSF